MSLAAVARLADLAAAEARRHPPRSAARRAAAHLWAAAELPGGKTIASVRSAIASFGTEATQAAALELLGLLTQDVPADNPVGGAAPTKGRSS